MPDGYLVSVGVKADFSQLKSEQKEATASIQDFAARGAAALEAFQAAAKKSGAAATFLNTQLKDLAAANVAVVPAMEQAVAALKQLQAAKTADAAASKAAAASTREMSQQTSVASINMRVLEGSTMGAARAAGQFAVNSLGLGSVLGSGFAAAAFGAVGLGMIVVSLGEKLYTAFDIGGEGARKLDGEMRSLNDSMDATNAELDVQLDKLDAVNAKLEHKPDPNGPKLAIDEATLAADRLQQKLDGDIKQIETILKGMGADTTKQVLTLGMGGTGTHQEQVLLTEHARHLAEATTEQEKLNESKRHGASLQARLNELQKWQTEGGGPGIETDFSNEIKATEYLIAMQEKEQHAIQTTIDIQAAQKQHGADAGIPKAAKEHQEAGQSYTDLAAQKREEGASLGELVLYWQHVVETTGKYHEQLLRAEEEFQKQINAPGKLKASLAKGQVGPEPAPFPPDFMEHKETEAEADERINKALEQQQKHAANLAESTMKIAEFKEKMGQISESEAAREKIAASQTEQNTVVGGLQAQQKAIAPMGPIGLDTKELAEWQKLQDQITAATEKGVKQRQLIQQQEALKTQQIYTQMFNSMYAPLQQFTDHWLQSGQRMGVAFQRMYDQMAMAVINALLKIAAQELIGLALHKTVGAQARIDDAKTAAAGAYKATVGIPYIGPILAPIAAGVAFAAVAAFESGADYIPRTGMAVLHEGEAVATKGENSQISKLISMSGNGGQGGGGPHFTYAPNISAIDGASVSGMARQHSATFVRQTMRQLRLMNKI